MKSLNGKTTRMILRNNHWVKASSLPIINTIGEALTKATLPILFNNEVSFTAPLKAYKQNSHD
jgi:hypothetical protein